VRGRKTSAPHVLRTPRLERLVEVRERWERSESKLQGRLAGRAECETVNLCRCCTFLKSLSRDSFRQFETVRFSRDPISPHLAPSQPCSSSALRFPPRARLSSIGTVQTAPESPPPLSLLQVQESGHETEVLEVSSLKTLKVSSMECTSPIPTSTRASAAIAN